MSGKADATLEALPVVLTVEEVAEVLRIGRTSAYEAVRRGEIPTVKIGRRVIVPRAALERLLASTLEGGEQARATVANGSGAVVGAERREGASTER